MSEAPRTPKASAAAPDPRDAIEGPRARWLGAWRRGRGRPAGVILLAALVTLLFADVPATRLVQSATFDTYQVLAPRGRLSAPVVVVTIDEASIRRYGQWPWPRTRLAQLVTAIAEHGPAAIGIDIIMPEPDRLSPERLHDVLTGVDPDLARRLARLDRHDTTLARALRGRSVVVSVAGLDAGDTVAAGVRSQPIRVVGADPSPFLPRFPGALRSLAEIAASAAGEGLVNAMPEAGVVRRLPLLAVVGQAMAPALGVEMLRIASATPALTVRTSARGVQSIGIADVVVPTEADGSVWVHFGRFDPGREISAATVLDGQVSRATLERKLVLVGVTAVGLGDRWLTPLGTLLPGTHVHAQMLENIFDGRLLSRPPWARWAGPAVLALGGLLLVLLVPVWPFGWSLALLLTLAGLTATGGMPSSRSSWSCSTLPHPSSGC